MRLHVLNSISSLSLSLSLSPFPLVGTLSKSAVRHRTFKEMLGNKINVLIEKKITKLELLLFSV